MNKTPTIRKTISLPASLLPRILAKLQKEVRTLSNYVQNLIRRDLDSEEKP